MKTTLTVTFTEDEWAMMERADEALKGWFTDVHKRRWRQWLIRRAAFAVARELVREKEIVLPLAVNLRMESREEVDERMGWRPDHPRFGGFSE